VLIRNTPNRWLCCFVLCCAGTVLGQSLNDNASGAGTSSFVSDTISASVNASAFASAQSNATQSSGYGDGRAAATGTLGSFVRGKASERGVQSVQTPHGFQPGTVSAHESLRLRGSQTSASERYGIAGRPQISFVSPASYSYDFPDSTKGTALLSPPDSGTTSPLDWSPALNYGFLDFAQQHFLNPTLHVSGHTSAASHPSGYPEKRGILRARTALAASGRVPQRDIFALPEPSLDLKLKTEELPRSILNSSDGLQP